MNLYDANLSKENKKNEQSFMHLDNAKQALTCSVCVTEAVFIIFPKLETRFNTHYQNA